MKYSTQVINLAGKYQIKPEFIMAIEQAYDYIARFSFIENENDLKNCVMEIKNGKTYTYKDIPLRTRAAVLKSIKKYGANGTTRFYSDLMKKTKLEEFLKVMIEHKIQPREFFEDGVLTYKNLMYANSEDKTSQIVSYCG